MVLGVCRAVLGDRHDAEDAFQATFLVLALRAGSIRRGDAVASWLYSAARRVALRARRQAARHRERERRRAAQAGAAEPVSAPPADPWPELYEELDRLPEPFRAVVVLCDLEGHSYEQAAGMLHCPVGTVQSRLARGRQRLRRRLESRGLSSAVVLVGTGAGLTARSATAAVSSRLATAIAKTAVSIAGGQTIAAVAPTTVAGLVGAEIRRLLMTRALTVLTTLLMAGLVAAAGIGLVIAGQRDDPKPNPIAATGKKDAGPIHVRVVDVQGKGAPGIAVELIGSEFDPPRSFQTDAEGHVPIPREIAGDRAHAVRQARAIDPWPGTMVGDPVVGRGRTGPQGEPDRHEAAPPGRTGSTGSVVDREGKPIAGVEIVRERSEPSDQRFGDRRSSMVATHFRLERSRTRQAVCTDAYPRRRTSQPQQSRHPRYLGQGWRKAGCPERPRADDPRAGRERSPAR